MDMIRKSSPLYDSIEVVAQHLIDSMQTYFELIEDHENTSVVAGYEAEWDESEYPEINKEYPNLVVVYMEELFFTNPTHISDILFIFQVYQDPCISNHSKNFYQILLSGLSLNMVKSNERKKIVEQFLD